jgi:hypothetical protein
MKSIQRFKHSGAFGDLLYSLPVMKYLGGGEFYLHLNQIDWIGQHYYGSPPTAFHQGRMTESDFGYLRDFMLVQDYITKFDVLDRNTEITHNLDKFRPVFVGHPTNYIDIYSSVFGVQDSDIARQIRQTPWLSVPNPRTAYDRRVVINRTARWQPAVLGDQWKHWQAQNMEDQAVFVGLPEEHDEFQKSTGWKIPHAVTNTMLEVAEIIAGADMFIGNQSSAFALAVGLGVPYWCEARSDLPLTRNECFFPDQPGGNYF